MLRSIEKTPEKVYLQFEQQRIMYEQLYDRITKCSAGFHELGIRKNDKVCVMLDNSPQYLDIWFGLSFLGAILVPINVHLKGEGLEYILLHSDCKAIVVGQGYLNEVYSKLSRLPEDIKIVVDGGADHPESEYSNHEPPIFNLKQLYENTQSQLPDVHLPTDSINSILYTSGTTGPPKGVMLSHGAYVHSAKAFAERMVGVRQEDILFTTLPLFHINAQAHTVLGSIYSNATIALGRRFSASRFWDEVRSHGATIFNSLGSMIPILCKQPEREDDQNNPARVTACAATPEKFWNTFEQRFGVKIVEGYGLTETTGFCISNPLNDTRVPSIGKPYPYIEAMIAGESGKRLQNGQVGEILIRSSVPHSFMEGYYKMPEKTKEAMKDGWFHTGDLGYADEDGYLYFRDRLKQCIRRRGENISSWEIEKIINDHPKVLETAAVGVPSDVGEEDVKVYIVLKDGEKLLHEEIVEWCEERMAYFMVPRYVQFIDAFPKTATERVQKFKLKEEGIGDAWDREKQITYKTRDKR